MDDSTWRDRYTPAELAERFALLGQELGEKFGWYETAAMLADGARALDEFAEMEMEIP